MGSVGIQGSGSIKDWLDYGEEDTRRGKGNEKYEMTAEDINTLRTALNQVDENTTFSDRQAIRALYNKLAKTNLEKTKEKQHDYRTIYCWTPDSVCRHNRWRCLRVLHETGFQ